MDLRKTNNHLKRELIETYALKGAKVLDMGCGAGGDFHKWKAAGIAHLVAADPSSGAINEARKRRTYGPDSMEFVTGEIWRVTGVFDFIFWNFSLQYLFDTEQHLDRAIDAMVSMTRPGSVIAGVVPDSQRIFMLPDMYEDPCGNQVFRGNLTGEFGDLVSFYIRGAPYYRRGPVPEPVAWRDLFVTKMEAKGFILDTWRPFSLQFTGTFTDLYSAFSFQRQ